MTIHKNPNGSTTVKGADGKIVTTLPSDRTREAVKTAETPSGYQSPLAVASAPSADLDGAFAKFKATQGAGHLTPVDLSEFRTDTSYPFPQANSLAKVAATLEAINDGADTDESIASAISVSARQGAYYGNATGYLGLAQSHDTVPRSWSLTPDGEEFLNCDPEDRALILTHLVSTIPVSGSTSDEAAEDVLNADNMLGETTAERRGATITSWQHTLASPGFAVKEMQLESDGVRDRIEGARVIADESRKRRQERAHNAAPVQKAGELCNKCFTVKSLAGSCNCD